MTSYVVAIAALYVMIWIEDFCTDLCRHLRERREEIERRERW